MTFSLRLSARARQDVDSIYDWLKARSHIGAEKWHDAYTLALDDLERSAAGCPRAPEADTLSIDLRQKLFQTRRGNVYRVLFLIRDNTVFIVSVRGAGQDWVLGTDFELPA